MIRGIFLVVCVVAIAIAVAIWQGDDPEPEPQPTVTMQIWLPVSDVGRALVLNTMSGLPILPCEELIDLFGLWVPSGEFVDLVPCEQSYDIPVE